jgi:putative ABC transport system ATP-binding protein
VSDIVTVEEVSRIYPRSEGDVKALDGVSLSVAAGETVAVTGASGSGKSTLLSLIAGLDRPSAGRIRVLEHELTEMNEDQRANLRRERMGFVFQNYHLLPTLSVCENVMLPLIPTQGHSLELKSRALHCIERVGLQRRINHLPSELSGGEQQRVGLARALITNPTLILADEPTGNLDSDSAGAILDLLFELVQNNGRTIVLSTHDNRIAERCARRLHLKDGKMHPH